MRTQLSDPVTPDERGAIGIRVDIADLGSCLTGCLPDLPPTGLDATPVVVAACVGLVLVAGGALFLATRRSLSR